MRLILLQATVFLLLLATLNASSLLVISVDRLLAVALPITYYRYSAQIGIILLVAEIAFCLLPMMFAVITTLALQERQISIYCKYGSHFFLSVNCGWVHTDNTEKTA